MKLGARVFIASLLMSGAVAACGSSSEGSSAAPGGDASAEAGAVGAGGATAEGGATDSASAHAGSVRLLIQTTWQEQDTDQTRPLTSDTDDCFAQGFNLKAMLALLPTEHDDTLRTDKVNGPPGPQWVKEKDEPVHITIQPSTDLSKATCAAPTKQAGCCGNAGGSAASCPCKSETMPTVAFSAKVSWSINGGDPIVFDATLSATPALVSVLSGDRTPSPVGWTDTIGAQYSIYVDPDGLWGTISGSGCSPCNGYVQRNAAFPPSRSVSSRS